MKCQYCGETLREGARFCPGCGRAVVCGDAATDGEIARSKYLLKDEGADGGLTKGKAKRDASEHDAPSEEDSEKPHPDDAVSDGGEAAHDTRGQRITDDVSHETQGDAKGEERLQTRTSPMRVFVGLALLIVVAAGAIVGYQVLSGAQENNGDETVLQLSEINDGAFRSYLEDVVDTNDDGLLSQAEADAVVAIGSVDGQGNIVDQGLVGRGVTSLAGIEHFTNLETLICRDNAITSLDLTQNAKLKYLLCDGNQLSSLVLPPNGSLSLLHANGNQLATIDLSAQEELVDVELDPSVSIIGNPGPSNDATVDQLEDLALVYAVAASAQMGSDGDSGEILVAPGESAEIDNMLIEVMASPNLTPSRVSMHSGAYLPELKYDDAGMILVPLQQGERVISSVYGALPSDLSYLYAGNGLASYLGDRGWYVFPAEGEARFEIDSDDLLSYGKLVRFVATVSLEYGPDYPATTPSYTFRVIAVEDEESIFGYHLVSMVQLT